MALFDFRCMVCNGYREVHAPMGQADKVVPLCHGRKMDRVYTAPNIKGEHAAKRLYDYEQQQWALATGEKHETAKDLDNWAQSKGKAIVGKGWKPKPQSPVEQIGLTERQFEKEIQKHYDNRHGLGEVK